LVDPRISIIEDRLKRVRNIIAVSSGKGGVGKSIIASTLALILARKGYKVGLFDLDFTSPSTHIILGVGRIYPEESEGIIPPEVHGLRYMSIVYYSHEHALPLRGAGISNVLIELLAVTKWNTLDFLIIDMPPGISDTTLDILRYVKRSGFLVVTTSSPLAFESVRKLIEVLSELKTPIIGVIENMKMKESQLIQQRTKEKGIKFWGDTPFDDHLEEIMGDANRLLETKFGKKLRELVEKNL